MGGPLKAIGCVLAIPLLLGLLLLTQCGPFWERPGEGAKARAGYEAARPAIAALEAWRHVHGDYPDTLEALIPNYLDSLPNSPEVRFFYSKDTGAPRLGFSYERPGANTCIFSPGAGWECSGLW